ncbi:XdhC family protein [Streptomyces sp. NPDC002346]
MAVGPGDEVVGSVSGGCVEGAVFDLAKEVVARKKGVPVRLITPGRMPYALRWLPSFPPFYVERERLGNAMLTPGTLGPCPPGPVSLRAGDLTRRCTALPGRIRRRGPGGHRA